MTNNTHQCKEGFMIKPGFVSAILHDLSFEEVVSFAAKHQYSAIEVMCWPAGKAERRYAGITHIDVTDLSEKNIKTIQTILKQNKVEISGLGYYPNPLEDDPEKAGYYIDHIKKVIAAANTLDIGIVNTFIGRDHTRNIEDNFGKFKEVWPAIIKFAEEQNVKVCIENCPMFFTNDEWPGGKNLAVSPAIWRRMFETIPSDNFGLNYDPSHMVWQFMDYIKPIYEFKDRIFHVHLKDVKVHPHRLDDVGIMANPLEFHSPKLPGLGDVNWGNFFSALMDIGYNGNACVEVEDRTYEVSLDMRKKSLIQSRIFLSQFIPL
jgi:sugar phosphate isomerase/epimerase